MLRPAVLHGHIPCRQEGALKAPGAVRVRIAARHREALPEVHFPGVHPPVHQEEDLFQVRRGDLHPEVVSILRVEEGNSNFIVLF